jgi:hypothetical protein
LQQPTSHSEPLVTLSSSDPSRITAALPTLHVAYPNADARVRGVPCNFATAATLEANIAALFAAATPSGETKLTRPFSQPATHSR